MRRGVEMMIRTVGRMNNGVAVDKYKFMEDESKCGEDEHECGEDN